MMFIVPLLGVVVFFFWGLVFHLLFGVGVQIFAPVPKKCTLGY